MDTFIWIVVAAWIVATIVIAVAYLKVSATAKDWKASRNAPQYGQMTTGTPVHDLREIQIIQNGEAVTKVVDAKTYDSLMELMKNPDNGQMVRYFLESL